jgi:hypothetical protein
LIVVDDCDLGTTDKGTSDRNGYGSVFDVLTIGSLRTYLLGTTITKSSFSMNKSGSKFYGKRKSEILKEETFLTVRLSGSSKTEAKVIDRFDIDLDKSDMTIIDGGCSDVLRRCC